MKKVTITAALVILALNLAAKVIFTNYLWFNFILSSVIICHTSILLYILATPTISDGYRYSLSSIYTGIGLIEFIPALFTINAIKNNWLIFSFLSLSGLQWLLLFVTKVIKKVLDDKRHD